MPFKNDLPINIAIISRNGTQHFAIIRKYCEKEIRVKLFTSKRKIIVQRKGPFTTSVRVQHCDNSAMMLAIVFSLKTMELIQNGIVTYFQETPLFSMRTILIASPQSCRSVDADAWCK